MNSWFVSRKFFIMSCFDLVLGIEKSSKETYANILFFLKITLSEMPLISAKCEDCFYNPNIESARTICDTCLK